MADLRELYERQGWSYTAEQEARGDQLGREHNELRSLIREAEADSAGEHEAAQRIRYWRDCRQLGRAGRERAQWKRWARHDDRRRAANPAPALSLRPLAAARESHSAGHGSSASSGGGDSGPSDLADGDGEPPAPPTSAPFRTPLGAVNAGLPALHEWRLL